MNDDGIQIPGPPAPAEVEANLVDWVINHGMLVAAIILGVVILGLWKRHTVIFAAILAGLAVFTLMKMGG